MKRSRIMPVFVVVGMLLIAIGIVLPLFTADPLSPVFRFIYGAGALLLLAGRVFLPYNGDNLRLKRLHRIEMWGALFFCVGAFFLFWDGGTLRDALAFTLAGAIIQIYTSIMIPRVAKKSEK